jgi:hypothetical protein
VSQVSEPLTSHPVLRTPGEDVSSEPPARARERLAPWPFWAFAGAILIGCIVFHSRTDPSIRYTLKGAAGDNFNVTVKQLALANYGPDWFLAQKFGKLTPCDVAIGLFAYLGLCYRWSTQRPLRFSRRARNYAVLIAIPMAIGLIVGQYHGATSVFGDSRYYVAGAVFALGLWSTILTSEEGCFRFAQLFALLTGVYGFVQLAQYATGGGEIAYYGRTTLAAHATLEYMVAGVAVAVAMSRTGRSRMLWWFTVVVCSMVVVLGFRRYAWLELASVFGMYLLLSGRRNLRAPLVIAASAVVAVVFLGSSLDFTGRVASFNPNATRQTSIYANTNQGHIDAALDGLYEIETHPITGLGTGVGFIGHTSGNALNQVQNAPIETWIRYSVVGFAVFCFVYFMLFRDLWRRRHGTRYSDQLGWGIGAFLFGQFLVICAVYPWPFDTTEKAVLTFSLVALAYPRRDRVDEPARETPSAVQTATGRSPVERVAVVTAAK